MDALVWACGECHGDGRGDDGDERVLGSGSLELLWSHFVLTPLPAGAVQDAMFDDPNS
jgi:hypothetical protein